MDGQSIPLSSHRAPYAAVSDGLVAQGATTRKVAPKVSPPCSRRLRTDLLNKLGIVDERSLKMPLSNNPSDAPLKTTVSSQKTVLGPNIKVTKAPLKKDEGPDPMLKSQSQSNFLVALGAFFRAGSSPPSSVAASISSDSSLDDDTTISSNSERQGRLTFDEEVSVLHIPRRSQYSNRIQQYLWHPAGHLQANVARNTIEYAADGWKWQDVREEQEHIRCPQSGELIHPVHEEIARMIRQEQGLPADAPVWTPYLKQAPIGSNNCSLQSK